MFNNSTLNQLRELRLPAMADCFKEQQNKIDIHSLSFDERFAFLVEAEWLSRRNKRTERLVRQAGFRFPAAVADIDWHSKNGIQKQEITRLSLGAYIKKAQNIIFSGPTGVGKTYLACAQGIQEVYARLSDFFLKVGDDCSRTGKHAHFRDKCANAPLLILDDWGLKKFSLEETNELSELFERRYNRAATIVSGQVPSTSWHELFPDPTQAESILDRIVHNAHTYSLSGESMRKAIGKLSLENQND